MARATESVPYCPMYYQMAVSTHCFCIKDPSSSRTKLCTGGCTRLYRVRTQQASQKQHHDTHPRSRTLEVGTSVMVRDLRDHSMWKPGVVVKRNASLSYLVCMLSGQILKRDIDHLKELSGSPLASDVTTMNPNHMMVGEPSEYTTGLGVIVPIPCSPSPEPPTVPSAPTLGTATDVTPGTECPPASPPQAAVGEPRYPTRQQKPVERLTY